MMLSTDERIGILEEVLEKMDECAEMLRRLNDSRIEAYCLADFEGRDRGWLGTFVRGILPGGEGRRSALPRAAAAGRRVLLLALARARRGGRRSAALRRSSASEGE